MREFRSLGKNLRTYLVFFAVAPTFLLLSCRGKSSIDASKFTVEIREGVRNIINHASQIAEPSPVRLEFLGKIGELEGRESKDILYEPADAARLPNGDILVLERGGCTLKRYNERYELIASYGRKGLGPGDFVSPYILKLDRKQSRLYIADRFISSFDQTGRFIDSFRYRFVGQGGSSLFGLYQTSGMALLSDSLIILPGDASIWTGSGRDSLLTVHDGSGAPVRSFGNILRFDHPGLTLNANIVSFATDGEDACYVVYAHQNRIDKYSSKGDILFSVVRPLPYEIKTEMKDELFTSGSVQRVLPWPSVTSVSGGVDVDEKNRIWVLTFLLQPNRFGGFDNERDFSRCYRFDVFGPDGILRFTVAVPNVPFSRYSIYGDRIYLIDPVRESCVYEYKIMETD